MATNHSARHYSPGIGNVGSYMVSGRPYLSSGRTANDMSVTSDTSLIDDSANKVVFPAITKSLTVVNKDDTNAIFVSFATLSLEDPDSVGDSVVKNNKTYWQIDSGESFTFNVKCSEIYVHGDGADSTYDLYAEITNIGKSWNLSVIGIDGITTV